MLTFSRRAAHRATTGGCPYVISFAADGETFIPLFHDERLLYYGRCDMSSTCYKYPAPAAILSETSQAPENKFVFFIRESFVSIRGNTNSLSKTVFSVKPLFKRFQRFGKSLYGLKNRSLKANWYKKTADTFFP